MHRSYIWQQYQSLLHMHTNRQRNVRAYPLIYFALLSTNSCSDKVKLVVTYVSDDVLRKAYSTAWYLPRNTTFLNKFLKFLDSFFSWRLEQERLLSDKVAKQLNIALKLAGDWGCSFSVQPYIVVTPLTHPSFFIISTILRRYIWPLLSTVCFKPWWHRDDARCWSQSSCPTLGNIKMFHR